jgi:hypothetical protein
MTPKEKAKELVTKYAAFSITTLGCGYEEGNPCIVTNVMFKESAKQCASIAVDEILYALSVPPIQNKGHLLYDGQIDYWQQVKQEIEKL